MTEAEKKEIVALVMSEISGQAVDFDLQTVTPQRTDILPAVRPDGAGGYTGVTLDWGGITDELTTQAKEFRNEALQAKKDTELLKGETNGIKSDVEYIYRQFNEAVDKTIESVRNVYQSDLNAESTARQTADNTLQQNIDSEASTRAEADTALGARIDSEVTTRKSEVAELERVNAIQKYEIENLKAKAEGKIYRTEIVDKKAYSLDVPSSVSPYAEVQKIGGKSVVWNQLVPPFNKTQTSNGITIAGDESGKLTITVSSEVTGFNQATLGRIDLIQGHKYLMIDNDKANGFEFYVGGHSGYSSNSFIFEARSTEIQSVFYYVAKTAPSGTYIKRPMTIDLTQMFGSGNEPTLEECQKIFSADYYPYDAGTIKSFPVRTVRSVNAEGTEIGSMDVSSVTSDLKSAGSVHDEWSNGKKTKRIGSYTFTGQDVWGFYSSPDNRFIFSGLSNVIKKISTDELGNVLLEGFTPQTADVQYVQHNEYSVATNKLGMVLIYVTSWVGKTTAEVASLMAGKTIYYELATPIEETVPEIDNYIEVEGGGTLTFESDDAVHMPVPSTTRFVVDLT